MNILSIFVVFSCFFNLMFAKPISTSNKVAFNEDVFHESEKYDDDLSFKKINVTLTPKHSTQIVSEVNTTIKTIYKNIGDSFKKGDVLIEMDSQFYAARLEAARASKEKAETFLKNKQELFKDGIASMLNVKEAEAILANANLEFVLSEKQFNSCTIIAPYDGQVTEVWAHVFEKMQENRPMMNIVYDKTLVAKFLIPSHVFYDFYLKKKIQILISETGEIIEGEIANIDSIVDAASSTMRIFANVNNENNNLKVGMTGILKQE